MDIIQILVKIHYRVKYILLWKNTLMYVVVQFNSEDGSVILLRLCYHIVNISRTTCTVCHDVSYYTHVNQANLNEEQSGAVEACWAHNPEVRGSKPRSAKIFKTLFSSELLK